MTTLQEISPNSFTALADTVELERFQFSVAPGGAIDPADGPITGLLLSGPASTAAGDDRLWSYLNGSLAGGGIDLTFLRLEHGVALGDGADTVSASAVLTVSADTTATLTSVAAPLLATGSGEDEIRGVMSLLTEDTTKGATVTVTGVEAAGLALGAGRDTITGSVIVSGQGDASVTDSAGVRLVTPDGWWSTGGEGQTSISGGVQLYNEGKDNTVLERTDGAHIRNWQFDDRLSATGSVNVDSLGTAVRDVTGLRAERVVGSADADTVFGSLDILTVADGSAYDGLRGAELTAVHTGGGIDSLSGSAIVDLASYGFGAAGTVAGVAGLELTRVATGDGDDLLSGRGELYLPADTAGTATGILVSGPVLTGAGADRVQADAFASGMFVPDVAATSAATGIDLATAGPAALLDLGAGDDSLVATATAQGGGFAHATGVRGGAAEIAFGDGDDSLTATATASGGMETAAVAIDGGRLSFGAGNDTVTATADAAGAQTPTGYYSASVALGLSGVTLEMGDGDDLVTATATVTPGVDDPATGSAIAIQSSTILLGDGNDRVVARGDTAGVRDAAFHGGAGADVFQLQDGTAQVDGGAGAFDVLVLEEDLDALTVTANGPDSVTLSSDAGTEIDTRDVEYFVLGGDVHTLGDLLSLG